MPGWVDSLCAFSHAILFRYRAHETKQQTKGAGYDKEQHIRIAALYLCLCSGRKNYKTFINHANTSLYFPGILMGNSRIAKLFYFIM